MLGADADVALECYGITAAGNFEGRSIPNRLHARGELARPPGRSRTARRRLFEAREQRPRPGLDDKVLTEWNALMISALAEAGGAARPAGLDRRRRSQAGEFLRRELRRPDGRWQRSWHADGEPTARHDALAADHAGLVDAFTRLAEATGAGALDRRGRVGRRHDARPLLGRRPRRAVHDADDGEALVARQKDLFDNATPSANSTAAVALYPARRADRRDRATPTTPTASCSSSAPSIDQAPAAFSHALLGGRACASAASPRSPSSATAPTSSTSSPSAWRPDVVLAWGEPYDSPLWEARVDGLAYVCRDYACQAPQDTPEGLRSSCQRRRRRLRTQSPAELDGQVVVASRRGG